MQKFYSDEPIANRSRRAATDGLVTVEIGDEEPKKYYIHRALLVHHSEYFRKALQGPWIEAKENRVVLKDVDEAVCRLNDLKLGSIGMSADLHKSQHLRTLALRAAVSYEAFTTHLRLG
jgi:hypothetical protein